MPAVPFSKTSTAPEATPWAWNADTIHAILGDDGDDWANLKAASAWWDGSTGADAEKQSVYKLAHHAMLDGKLTAIWHGVSNAMARLEQSDIPEADMKPVFDHLAKHYAQWDKTPPDWDRFLRRVRNRQAVQTAGQPSDLPASVTRAPMVLALRPRGVATDDDLALIQTQARTPLTAQQVYIIPSEISSETVDAYYTRMTPWTLAQFAADATTGVSFCDSHQHYQLPMGRSYYGAVTPAVRANGAQVLTTQALAYMVRGMRLPGGLTSDDVITGIEAGIYQDVSVGFVPVAYWCSICDCNMLTGDCWHWPGQTYETQSGDELCTANVDARLAEYSLVYDGATPNAMILKAERMIEAGRAPARMLRFVEDHTRQRLFARFPGYRPPPEPAREDDDMKGSAFVAGVITRARETATRAGKEVSQENLDRLQGIHDQLSTGHDTMDDAMRAMAAFIAEKAAPAANDGDDTGGGLYAAPARASHPKAGSGAKGKSSNKKADPEPDGDDPPPDDEPGDGEDGEEDAAEDEDGECAADGEDTEDAKPPKDPNPPGTDDGDGDDDSLTKPTGKGKASKKRALVPAGLTAQQRHLIAIGERAAEDAVADALAWGVRALGAGFDRDRYQRLLQRLAYDDVLAMRDDWQAAARQTLGARGAFTPDPQAPGGGYWDDAPTGQGGRQTAPRDPNNPLAAPRAPATPTSALRAGDRRRVADVGLYTTSGKRRP